MGCVARHTTASGGELGVVPPLAGNAGRALVSLPGRLALAGDLGAERFERRDVDLRERGEWLDRVAQNLEWHLGADRQRRLLKPLAGLRAERVGAGEALAVA